MGDSLGTVRVSGLRELNAAIRECDLEIQEFMTAGLLEIAENVAKDVRAVYTDYSEIGAEGVVPKVRKSGVAVVQQSLRKSRDLARRRQNFGGLMMRKAFLPALDKNKASTQAAVEGLYFKMLEIWGVE